VNRNQILERERRLAPYAGASALLVPVLFIISTAIATSISVSEGLATDELRTFSGDQAPIAAASILRGFAFLAMALPLYLLFRAAQARSERVLGAMVGFVAIAPLFLAAQSVLVFIGQDQLASDFVAAAGPGGDIYTLLDDLAEDNSVLIAAGVAAQIAGLALIVVMIYVPLQAMRVGLLTRFFATLGMALGVAAILLPALTPLPLALWFGWLGSVILDKVPKGRPPAWDTGEAIPWPSAGQQREEQRADTGDDVVEGDAMEVLDQPGEGKDQTARRERARKRKRKQRR
jgi:hypothetical protein